MIRLHTIYVYIRQVGGVDAQYTNLIFIALSMQQIWVFCADADAAMWLNWVEVY